MNKGYWILLSGAEGHTEGHILPPWQPPCPHPELAIWPAQAGVALAQAGRGPQGEFVRGGDVLGIGGEWEAVPRRQESHLVEFPSSLRSLCVPTTSMAHTHTHTHLES